MLLHGSTTSGNSEEQTCWRPRRTQTETLFLQLGMQSQLYPSANFFNLHKYSVFTVLIKGKVKGETLYAATAKKSTVFV